MRLMTRLLIPCSVLAVSLSAVADDSGILPPTPPQTSGSPSFTFPPPMHSSAGQGVITNGNTAPVPTVHGESAPTYRGTVVGSVRPGWVPLGSPGAGAPRSRRSDREMITNFQSSEYWTAPQPFAPGGAPNYSDGLAGSGGTHIRYPYFKYRAPWTYQGPAGISHTIVW